MLDNAIDNLRFTIRNDDQIQSLRDLEDFVRLWVNVAGLHAGLVDSTFKLGLKWKSHGALKPAIKIYPAGESDGDDAYLKDDVTALSQTLGSAGTALGTVVAGTTFLFPSSFWEGSFGGQPAVSGSYPDRYLLFEGVAEGKGEIVVTLHKADGTEIAEGSSVWLHNKPNRAHAELTYKSHFLATLLTPPHGANHNIAHAVRRHMPDVISRQAGHVIL